MIKVMVHDDKNVADTGFIVMILFCKWNHNLIPNSVPKISRETINDYVRIRLQDPDVQAELQALDVDPHAHDSESDMDDAEIKSLLTC